MHVDHHTLLLRACRIRWPSRHVAGLAQLLGCPKSTVAAWLSGRRRMSPERWAVLAEHLVEHGRLCLNLADDLSYAARKAGERPRMARGFQVVMERDGPGSLPRDGRWRGGRRKARA